MTRESHETGQDNLSPKRKNLKPDRDIQKFLISSTCRFTGEYESEDLILAHAWPGFGNRAAFPRKMEGVSSRNTFALVFRTDPRDHDDLVIPSYDYVGDLVCTYLSVLYGKRFDNHGAVESSGFFNMPDLGAYNAFCIPTLPQNAHRPRADCGVPLVLNEIHRLIPLLFSETGYTERAVAFRGAVKFYYQALQAAEHDIEVAYLHLITAGEILSDSLEIAPNSLIDAQTRAILARIEDEMQDGVSIARAVRSKLRSVKRRFVAGLASLVDESFFERSEAKKPFAQLKPSGFASALGAAYDLRSRYVHTGRTFGGWITPRGMDNEEIQIGRPVVDDKEYGRTLASAPTYIGLERIIRYGLLRFATRLGVDTAVP